MSAKLLARRQTFDSSTACGPRLPWDDVSQVHQLRFDGKLLERGFWLYVWEVTTPVGETLHYVGRTGDNSSINAQSPFARMAQHLGFAKTSMMLRKHLDAKRIDPKLCGFRLIAHGPILPEAEDRTWDLHKERRDIVGALERDLCKALAEAGYNVMNVVKSKAPLDSALFRDVRRAFADTFTRLRTVGD